MAALVKPRTRFLLLAAGLIAVALLLASCGGGGAAPAPPAATATPLPAGVWVRLWQVDAVWEQIAAATTLVKPILRPSYLPPGLIEVQRVDPSEPLRFSIVYADASHEKWLSLTAGVVGKTALAGPDSQQEEVVIRHTYATYQLFNKANPTGDTWLLWQEPGRWGAPGDPNLPNLDHVPYFISSRGFSKDDLMKVADSLQPVQPVGG